MHFIKLTGSALTTNTDPRCKLWAEFHCDLCDKNSWVDVTSRRASFDFERERRCSHCGQISSVDRELNLKANIDRLTQEKNRIQVQIDTLINELGEVKELSNEKAS